MTETGQRYFERCQQALEDIREAERLASGEYTVPKGNLSVTAPIVFGRLYVAPIIVEFLKAYPEIDIDLRLADTIVDLVQEHSDVAVRIGSLPDSGLKAVRAGEIRHVVCASPGYLSKCGIPQHPRELAQHDCITFTTLHAANEWTFKRGRRVEGYPVHSRLSVSTAEAAVDAAVAGVGITRLLCYQVSEGLAAGKLAILMREFEPAPLPVHLVHASGKLVPQKLRAFLDFVLPRLKSKLVFDP